MSQHDKEEGSSIHFKCCYLHFHQSTGASTSIYVLAILTDMTSLKVSKNYLLKILDFSFLNVEQKIGTVEVALSAELLM